VYVTASDRGPLAQLRTAFLVLTRLPVSRRVANRPPFPIAQTVWAFPLVGAVVGALGGAAYAASVLAQVPPSAAAICALVAMVLVTGGLHEDGLADTADGFGGGATRERKLEIMRDSRIGSFGATALILSLAARAAAIASIAQPMQVTSALVVAAALSRVAMILLMLTLGTARSNGLAAGLGDPAPGAAIAAFAIALTLAGLLLPLRIALRAIAGALLAAGAMAWLARHQIRGYTGDVLGATLVVAESVAIALIAGVPPNG
jgi:adenosylcobinamide-GDP ribazoletransferase